MNRKIRRLAHDYTRLHRGVKRLAEVGQRSR